MEDLKVIQHNVLKWTAPRATELYNIYRQLDPDIILLNSTGRKQNEKIKIFGYKVYQRNYLNEEHAGIAIAIKNNIQHKINDNNDGDVMGVEVETNLGNIMIITAYAPPRHNMQEFQSLTNLMRKTIPVYCFADLNANHPTFGYDRPNPMGRGLANLVNRNIITYLGPDFKTYITQNSATSPDIALGNRHAYLNLNIQEGPVSSSDHIPMYIRLATKPIAILGKKTWKIYKANWPKFKDLLTTNMEKVDVNENSRLTKNEIEKEMDKWFDTMSEAMKVAIPTSRVSILPAPKLNEVQKRLLYRYKTTIQLSKRYGWSGPLRYIYKIIQNKLRDESVKAYNENWHNLIQSTQDEYSDAKTFWRTIKRLMGNNESPAPYLYKPDGSIAYSEEDKIKLFHEIWTNIFQISAQENTSFDADNEQRVEEYLRRNRQKTNPFPTSNIERLEEDHPLTKPMTMGDMNSIIKNMKDKAPGDSGIRKSILINCPAIALQKLKEIINHAISMGLFPSKFKYALLSLLGKEGKDLKNPANYRPISLLEVPGKIMERLVHDRLVKYLENNHKLNNNQYAFRKQRGTQQAIATLYETVALSQREGHRCNIICRDVAKAFDKVWHDGLKYKILHLELPEIYEKLLCSFITERKARIRLNNQESNIINLLSGVPQGSILSPTLYNVYTADLPPPGPGCTDVSFADDNTQIVVYPGRGREALAIRTAREIQRINNFEKQWKIKTNLNKFQLLSISAKRPNDVIVDGTLIPFNREAKILGLTITTSGIKHHIAYRKHQAYSQQLKLKRFKKMTPKIKLHLYKALIRPVLEYPVVPICITSKSNQLVLQRVQNKALRWVHPSNTITDRLTNEQIHHDLDMEPQNTRLYHLASKTWNKLEISNSNLVETSIRANQDETYRDHYWWPRISPYILGNEPNPLFK